MGCAMGYGVQRFGSINEVIDEDGLECLNDGKARRLGDCEGCSTGPAPWLDRAKQQLQNSGI